MPLFKAWSEGKLNKKFVVAEKFVWASFADILKRLWYQEIREMINRRIYRVYFVHSFVGAFKGLLSSPLNVGFLERTFY